MSNKEKETFYVTTPIYYPSDKLHIGHAYTTVAADTIAKFKKLDGYDTMFLTGSDDHGQKIERKAEEADKSPKEYVDEIVTTFKELWEKLGIDYDYFIRTTEPRHEKVIQKAFSQLYEQGDIYKDKYEGWYCTPCESFWSERQLDEKKVCPDCERELEWIEEENYFFKMTEYADDLLEHIENHPEFIQPESRRNEMINYIKEDLEDLSVSRTSFDWGIPVPFDEEHVIYVWFDAICNYITAIGYKTDEEMFKRYWPADVQLVGKDILRFHTVIWPTLLMALDLPLPDQVFGHGWLLTEEGKMSKSKGNVVDPLTLIEDFGVDAIRYYLMREVPFGTDGTYSTEALIQRINSDLANDLGNLLNRTVSMVNQYFDGVIPEPVIDDEVDQDLIDFCCDTLTNVKTNIEELKFTVALEELWNFIRRSNKYIDQTKPWILGKKENKKNRDRLKTVLYNLLEALRIIAVVLKPFMVKTPFKIGKQIGIEGQIEEIKWEDVNWGGLDSGITVKKGKPIFPRIEMEEYFENIEEEKDPEEEKGMDTISFDEFKELDIRVAEILEAEKIEDSDKLLKLKVDIGSDERQLVAGIANHYQPDSLIGEKVLVLANMEPAEIFGVKSNGMILAASNNDDLTLTTVKKAIENGARVK